MKRFIFLSLATVLFAAGSAAWWHNKKIQAIKSIKTTTMAAAQPANETLIAARINQWVKKAKQYAIAHQFNTETCFLVDMQVASGKPRFYVYDFEKDSVQMAGLVTHGRCNQNWLEGRKYGNAVGCGCTSLGKYKIGNPYQGRFGLAYKLYGLDTGNSNAFNRFVVLHSHDCVPETTVDPNPICQSDGCPTVSPGFLKRLAPILDNSKKPVLLWIFE